MGPERVRVAGNHGNKPRSGDGRQRGLGIRTQAAEQYGITGPERVRVAGNHGNEPRRGDRA